MSQPNGTIAYVHTLPKCSFCSAQAQYDFKTQQGPWAYGCQEHYDAFHLYDKLGTGMGQKLEARPDAVSEVKQNHE